MIENRIERIFNMINEIKKIDCGDDIHYDFMALTKKTTGRGLYLDEYITVGDIFPIASDIRNFNSFVKGLKRLMRMYRNFYNPIAE